jgi:hypothetical protein
VYLDQLRKRISFRIQPPRRSGRRHRSTVSGLATKIKTAITRRTPGKTSRPRPTAVREITRRGIPTPLWNRLMATPMLKRSCAPTPSRGFSTARARRGR